MTTADQIKVALLFLNAFAGFIAAAPGDNIDPSVRIVSAALVAACGAALLFLDPPNKSKPSPTAGLTPKQIGQIADELLKRHAKEAKP